MNDVSPLGLMLKLLWATGKCFSAVPHPVLNSGINATHTPHSSTGPHGGETLTGLERYPR
jgi:hypothetical protein